MEVLLMNLDVLRILIAALIVSPTIVSLIKELSSKKESK